METKNPENFPNFYSFHRASGLDTITASCKWMSDIFERIQARREVERRKMGQMTRAKKKTQEGAKF